MNFTNKKHTEIFAELLVLSKRCNFCFSKLEYGSYDLMAGKKNKTFKLIPVKQKMTKKYYTNREQVSPLDVRARGKIRQYIHDYFFVENIHVFCSNCGKQKNIYFFKDSNMFLEG